MIDFFRRLLARESCFIENGRVTERQFRVLLDLSFGGAPDSCGIGIEGLVPVNRPGNGFLGR